jgi:hypothetical protein
MSRTQLKVSVAGPGLSLLEVQLGAKIEELGGVWADKRAGSAREPKVAKTDGIRLRQAYGATGFMGPMRLM